MGKIKNMKLALTLFASAFGLQCWTCNSKTYAECQASLNGLKTPLGLNEDKTWVCAIEESRRHGSKVDGVIMGCKQQEACINDQASNTDPHTWPQCNMDNPKKISKCRQCAAAQATADGWKDNSGMT